MSERIVKPEVVIQLTDEQRQALAPLLLKRQSNSSGMILGSIGLSNDGKTIGLSYIPHATAKKISELAYEEIGGPDVIS